MLKTVATLGGGGVAGAVDYQGTWDANANNPTLVSSVGTKGYYYVVSTAGTTNLNGINLWSVGDWAVFNGSVWEKVDGASSEAFNSITVTGLTGFMYANANSPVTAMTTIPAGDISGLGTMATQNANAVVITGGTINSATLTSDSFSNANITSVAVAFPNSYLANSSATIGNTVVTLGSTINSIGNLALNNATIIGGTIGNLSSAIPVASGGTGQTTFASGAILFGAGTSGINTNTNLQINGAGALLLNSQPGTSGQVITSSGPTAPPTYTTLGTMSLQNANAVVITGGTINVQASNLTSTTTGNATFSTSSLLLVPAGFFEIDLNGTIVKVPYYGV